MSESEKSQSQADLVPNTKIKSEPSSEGQASAFEERLGKEEDNNKKRDPQVPPTSGAAPASSIVFTRSTDLPTSEHVILRDECQNTSDPSNLELVPTPLSNSGPPSLNYTLRTRYLSICIFWSLILFDSIAIPIALYFALWYGTNLSPNAVFSISTGALGGVSIFEYFLRFWRLWKKGSTCRVLNARRWYLDWFHWNFSAAWIFIMAELIIGTVFTNPPIRLLAMPVSSLLFWFGISLMVQDTMRLMNKKSPIRISSVAKGEPLRMGIYSIIEDVVAVDGGGGSEFRIRLNARYEASHWFRLMLHRLTLFWASGALGAATVTTVLIFTLEKDPAYVVGWVLPFIWAGIWALATTLYVKRCLRREHRLWGTHRKDSFVVPVT